MINNNFRFVHTFIKRIKDESALAVDTTRLYEYHKEIQTFNMPAFYTIKYYVFALFHT